MVVIDWVGRERGERGHGRLVVVMSALDVLTSCYLGSVMAAASNIAFLHRRMAAIGLFTFV